MATQTQPDSTAVARHAETRVTAKEAKERIEVELSRFAPSFAKVLPKYLTPDRMVSLTFLAATKNPKLYECTPITIAQSVMDIARWGLEIGTTAHLVPFYNKKARRMECKAIADYKGLIQLILQSRHVRDVWARAVYQGEHFRVQYGTHETLEHDPVFGEKNRQLTHAYAVAVLAGQRFTFEVMGREDIDAVRDASPNGDAQYGPWKTHYAEMAKKTAIRRLAKRLPQSPNLYAALQAEEDVELTTPSVLPAIAKALDADESPDADDVDRRPTRVRTVTEAEYGGASETPMGEEWQEEFQDDRDLVD